MECQYYNKQYAQCDITKYSCYQMINAIPIKENCQIFRDEMKSKLEQRVEEIPKNTYKPPKNNS